MPLSQEARDRLVALWDDIGPKTAVKFWERARREGIPAARKDVLQFVEKIPDKELEKFTWPKQPGKAFARGPNAEWKVDLIVYSKPSADGYFYVMVRINSFSRELDAVPLESKSPDATAAAMETLLSRAPKPEKVLTDLGTEWGGAFAKLLAQKDIDHADKDPADHGSFAVLDTAIRTLKQQIAVLRRTKEMDLADALRTALREHNADINDTTGTAPKNVAGNKEATFFILQQQAQNLLHNLRENEKVRARVEGREGLRPLILGKKDEERRDGPKERADDPRWGEQLRVAEGPNQFQFGRVITTDGQSLPMKLTQGSTMVAPADIPESDFDYLRQKLETPMRQLWEHMIDVTGPLAVADAVEWLRDQGADLSFAKRHRASDIFKPFPFLQVDRGVLLAVLRGYEGLDVSLTMTRPVQVRPRRVIDAKYVAPFEFGPNPALQELQKDPSLYYLTGLPYLRQLKQLMSAQSGKKKAAPREERQGTLDAFVDGTLPPMLPAKATRAAAVPKPPQPTLDAFVGQRYGCSKCRYSPKGCARCRDPNFKGYRGPRPVPSE